MGTIYPANDSPKRTVRTVQTLGWLLRHRHDVVYAAYALRPNGNIIFRAWMKGGRMFECVFSDFQVCADFQSKHGLFPWATVGYGDQAILGPAT